MPSTRRHGARRASLSARGHLLTTLAPFGWFVAGMLLASGIYLFNQQFANPLQSSDAGLIFGAVLLAMSLALFSAIWSPAKRQDGERGEKSVRLAQSLPGIAGSSGIGYEVRAGGSRLQGYAGRYVDHARLLIGSPQARGIAGK